MTKRKSRTLSEWTFSLFIFLMPILPEYFRIGGYPVIVFLSLIPFLMLTVTRHQLIIPKVHRRLIVALLLLSCLSYGVHREISSLLRYILTVILSLIMILNYVKTDENKYDAMRVLSSAGTLMCFFAIIEKITGFNVFSLIETVDTGIAGQSSIAAVRNGVARIELSFGTAIVAGLYMIFINAISFFLLKDNRTPQNRKPQLLFTYIMTFVITYWTDSRMCMMSILFLQILFFLRGKWNKRLIIIIATISILAFDFAIDGILTQFLGRYITLISSIASSGLNTSDITAAYRLNLVPTLFPLIMKKTLFGYGADYMNNFNFSIWGHSYFSVDNMFLDVPLRHGLIGLVLVLLPIIYGIKTTHQLSREGENAGYYFTCVILIYLINLFSVTQLGEQRIFYIIVGILMAFVCVDRKKVMPKTNE